MCAYVCDNCGKEFASNQNLKYHNDNNACKVCDFSCKYCEKKFTSATNMYRHIRSACKIKKKDDDEKAEIYERLLKLEEENKLLKMKVVSLEKSTKNTKTVNNVGINNGDLNINKGIVNNTTNQIIVVGYGQEDLSKLDKSQLIKILQNGYNSTVMLTEAVHFNPKYPEHHNIYISNMRDKYAMMFDGKDWNLTMKEDLISKIYDDKKNYIEENLDEFIDSLSSTRKKALDRWLETDDDDEKISRIKNEIKLLMYNKRSVVLGTHANSTSDTKKPQLTGATTIKKSNSKKIPKSNFSDN